MDLSDILATAPDKRRPVSFRTQAKIARDVDDQAQNLTGWSQVYDQLSPGAFLGTLTEVWLGELQVFRETTSHMLRQSCEVWADSLWLGIPMDLNRSGMIGPNSMDGEVVAVRPGGVPFELLTPQNFDILGVVVKVEALQQYAVEIEHADLDTWCFRRPILPVAPLPRRQASEYLVQMLDAASHNPGILEHTATCNTMSDALFAVFWDILDPAAQRCFQLPANVNRYKIVNKVREYVIENCSAPVSVPELCRYLRLSRRTLQYCFQDVLGMSPLAYLKAIRLNCVRRALRNSQSGYLTVQDAAAAWGFWHPSQFAQDYRKLFGEYPSQSLRMRTHQSLPARVE